MKAHMIFSGALAALLTVGCGSEPAAPTPQAKAPEAKPKVEPTVAPQTAVPVPDAPAPVSTNAPVDVAIAPVDSTPKHDIFRSAGVGDIESVKYHLANGIKLNARDKTGKTALLWAVRSKKHEVIYHLLDRGADPNVADNKKVPPLFWAIRMNRPELVSALLDKGANIKQLDAGGKGVFDYAKDDTVIEILRSHEKK